MLVCAILKASIPFGRNCCSKVILDDAVSRSTFSFVGCVKISHVKGPVTRSNFSCNLQRNSTLKRCQFVTKVWYVKKSTIGLQVARKIALYDRALSLDPSAYSIPSVSLINSWHSQFK